MIPLALGSGRMVVGSEITTSITEHMAGIDAVTRSRGKESIHAPGPPPGHIIRAAMIDKAHLIDKHILFRLQTIPNAIYGGIVRGVEADGFWIEAPALTSEMRRDAAWGHVVEQFQDPSLLFVPTTSLMLLIAAKE